MFNSLRVFGQTLNRKKYFFCNRNFSCENCRYHTFLLHKIRSNSRQFKQYLRQFVDETKHFFRISYFQNLRNMSY
jgi:hypothetical protein